MRKSPGILTSAFFALLPLSGCATIDYLADDGEKPSLTLEGKSLEHIRDAVAIDFQDGVLIVANRGDTSGIALIDVGSDRIGVFHAMRPAPSTMALKITRQLYVVASENGYMAQHILNPSTKWIERGSSSTGKAAVFFAGSTLYTAQDWNGDGYRLMTHHPDNSGGSMGLTLFANPILAVMISGGRLFVAEQGRRTLRTFDNIVANGVGDSINLAPPGDSLSPWDTRIPALAEHEGYIFAAVSRGPAATDESSYVAVIEAATGSVVKIIPLNFRNPISGSLRGSTWYLSAPGATWESSGNHVPDGGIEAINLETQAHVGVIMTEAGLDGELGGFVATAPGVGYAIVVTGSGGTLRSVRKVTY